LKRKSSSSLDRTVLIPGRNSSNSKGPAVLRVLSKSSVFIVYIVAMVIILVLNASCAYLRVNSCTPITDRNITVNGSTAFAPLVKDVANEYQQKCFGVKITVNSGNRPQGSLNGLNQVEQRTIDIGTSDVFANPKQYQDLKDYQVAVVVFALVVNASVDITNLTTDQVRRIYSGDSTNWHDVGSSKDLDIVRISRPPTSGTRLTFEKYVLGGIETVTGPQSLITDTTETVARSVKEQQGAIGYVSLYYAREFHLKILSIDGKNPENPTFVKNDVYKFWNIEHMYTKGTASIPAIDFIDHMFSADARKIIHDDAYLDPAEFSPAVLANHVSQI
jgi:phosphate transport system substrate-binding protein